MQMTDDTAVAEDTVRLDFAACEIWIRATSPMEKQWRARSCAKEPWTVAWIEHHIEPGQVLYDIGANVGTFSLLAARHRGAAVVAFEPGYATFARLCENIQLNGCQHAIIPVPLPLAETSRLVGFKYRSVDPGQSRHGLKQRGWRPRPSTQDDNGRHYEQPVCAIPLDQAIAQFQLPEPDHIKIDVDGAELRVLAGAARTLALPRLRTVLVESDLENWDRMASTLHAAGFDLKERYRREHKPDAPSYGLFVRRTGRRTRSLRGLWHRMRRA